MQAYNLNASGHFVMLMPYLVKCYPAEDESNLALNYKLAH
jgi:hypothetical protein